MLEEIDFKAKEKSFTATHIIEGSPIRLYVAQDKGDKLELENKLFSLMGYAKGIPIQSICSKYSLKEINDVIGDITEDWNLISDVVDEVDIEKFLKKESEKYPYLRNERYTRYSNRYQEDNVKMYVQYDKKALGGKGGWLTLVWDYEVQQNKFTEGQLAPAFMTEKEAICLVDKRINQLNVNRWYDRTWKRTPKNLFKHEKRVVKPTVNEKKFIIDNIETKKKYEFLMAQSKLYDTMNGDN